MLIGVGIRALCVVGAIDLLVHGCAAENTYALGHAGEPDKVVFNDLIAFGLSYWYMVATVRSLLFRHLSVRDVCCEVLRRRAGTRAEFGGWLLSTLTLFTMIGTPYLGLFW